METQRINISDLACDPANVRAHDGKNLDAIKASLQRFGQQKPIVVNEKGIVIAGNGTLTAARALGWEAINIVRTELAGSEAVAYAIADNRTAELAEWDDEALAKQLSALQIEDEALVEAAGFTDAELTALVDEVTGITEGNTDPDEVPEVPEEPTAQPGQIWQLGNHRLMCGDSTSVEDMAALMDGQKADMVFTDPPYGVNYEGGHFHSGDVNIKRKREKLENDLDDQIYSKAIPIISKYCDGPCYTWFADTKPLRLYEAVQGVGQIHALLIWHKTNATYAAMNAQYKQRHEPCLYWKPKGSNLRWAGPTTESTIWEIKKDGRNNFHPTQKPVELAKKAIGNHSAKTVLDLFLGSGSTLIACEQTGRKCYGMELSPAYCDVIIKRWEDFTGQTAELANG